MNCIIIEDEKPAQNILKNFIRKVPNIELLDCFQTAKSAYAFLKDTKVDFIFLDINLPDILGIDFIKTVKDPPLVIITTAYPDYALGSFELETIVDYLVKPFSFDRFLKSIRKIEKRTTETITETIDHTFLNIDKTLHKLFFKDLLYIESDRNYIVFVTINKKHVLIDTLKCWNSKLPKYFFQLHKSYIVNLNHIEKISGNEVFVDKKRIPIGRTFKSEFLKNFTS